MQLCSFAETFSKLVEAQVQISYGPMEIGVQMIGEEEAVRRCSREASAIAKEIFLEVLAYQPLLRMKGEMLTLKMRWPRVVRHMVTAVRQISPTSLTPMAAVAGAVSDELLSRLIETSGERLTRILVNNGGDMAVFSPNEPVRIGIRGATGRCGLDRTVTVTGRRAFFGMATSGWQGRSFSQGVADAVAVVAPSGAMADAAATYIGNRVNDEALENVERRRAVEIDPATDIPNLQVTVECGVLKEEEKKRALANGAAVARSLMDRSVIWGVGIYLQGRTFESAKSGITFK